ncbi:MAG TPA: serine/threonine-protein kinase [Planctomycetia bacterium]|nr:serine/threonine-protein kinase [Planctomycetia bacterium]
MPLAIRANSEPIPGYRLLRFLGRGGVGEVWQAEAPGKLLKAIKLIATDHSEILLKNLELQGLAKIRAIRHPYLLSIDRYEVVEGYVAIVMELADKSLADRFEECAQKLGTGIPREELLRYMSEAAEVLDVMAAEHGLQHLDVKPENLFLMSGHVKVADFGLVQQSMQTLAEGTLAFTPSYAPPELFHGNISATADQYSLAVAYQELLTGRRPYAATSFRELVFLHGKQPPDVSGLPDLDREIVLRALALDPEHRYPTCSAFVAALAGDYKPPTTTVKPPGLELSSQPRGAQYTVTQKTPPREKVESRNFQPFVVGANGRGTTTLESPTANPLAARTRTAAPSLQPRATTRIRPSRDRITNTFIAYLPLEMYAPKLRAFIDALEAHIEGVATANDTLLRLRSGAQGWLFGRRRQTIYLRIETSTNPMRSDTNIVEATVFSNNKSVTGAELNRRGLLLIRALKSYLMASEKQAVSSIDPESLRRELWANSHASA